MRNSIFSKKINIMAFLFYILYVTLIINNMTRWVIGISCLRTLLNYSSYAILLVLLFLKVIRMNIKETLISIILVSIGIISYVVTKDNIVLMLFLLLICAKDIDINKIVKLDLILKVSLVLIIFILYRCDLTKVVIIDSNIERGLRYSFGFGHPNTFGIYMFNICADLLYINYSKKNKWQYILIIFISYLVDKFCDSRCAFLCMIIMIILSLFTPKKNLKIINAIYKYSFFIFLFISLGFTLAYIHNPSKILYTLNSLFSGRISLMSSFYSYYGIKLFGNYFINYSTGKVGIFYVLDNAYISLLVKFGLVISIILGVLFIKRIQQSIEKNEKSLMICLVVYIIFGLMENGLYLFFYNPFILSLTEALYNKKICKDTNK